MNQTEIYLHRGPISIYLDREPNRNQLSWVSVTWTNRRTACRYKYYSQSVPIQWPVSYCYKATYSASEDANYIYGQNIRTPEN